MKRRFYFQKYEKQSSPDDLLRKLNQESTRPKFIDYIITNTKNDKKIKMIDSYRQRNCKSLDPVRNIKMDTQTMQEEYFKFLTNTENGTQYKILNTDQQQKTLPKQSVQCLSKILSFQHKLQNPF
ncbi:unnamed protein product [Paramecium sonneborni]|uniref:Uncharacterized protein n=1 Tax=Paramecium sonneborni TaxID=65129 RepID=A0A8S1M6T8_9CILI|nr:unnamed protein product [Paramecium sonneborni]